MYWSVRVFHALNRNSAAARYSMALWRSDKNSAWSSSIIPDSVGWGKGVSMSVYVRFVSLCVCVCVQTDGRDRLHAGNRDLSGPERRVHIRQDQCIQDRTKARELSGLYVTCSEALHREPCSVLLRNTWHIKAPKGNEFQRSRAARDCFVPRSPRRCVFSELLDAIM